MELKKIADTSIEPFNQVCSIETYRVRKLKNRNYQSTGFFISPNVILTAGHNLFSNNLTKVTNIKITPGKFKENNTFDILELKGEKLCQSSITVHPDFNWNKVNYDFGIIIIPDSILENKNTPKTPVFNLNQNYALNIGDKLNVAGFPASQGFDGSIMTHESQLCQKFTAKKISHSFDTRTGNSGSPIWVEKNSERSLVGIHTYAEASTRIDLEYINLINSWIEEKKSNNLII